MAEYNQRDVIYNQNGDGGGASYNSDQYIRFITQRDSLKSSEKIALSVSFSIVESILKIKDIIDIEAIFENLTSEKMAASDDSSLFVLFQVLEELGIFDTFDYLVVLATVNEKIEVLQQIQLWVELFQEHNITFDTTPTVEAYLGIMERFGLEELKNALLAALKINDTFGMTDHEPQKAVSDFLIGSADENDKAFDWLLPFGLMVDWDKTDIPIMPEAELTTIEIPGVDGSIIADSKYRDRIFKIVAYSPDGMTPYEKEEMKTKITQVLDTTKHQSKKLTVQVRGTSFDVRYDGEAEITPGPSYIKVTIPFHTPPYGRDMFDNELSGSGLISNEGDTATGPVHTIKGPIQNPSFMLGNVSYLWDSYVPDGYNLVIDHQRKTCFLVSGLVKTNALARLRGNFQLIPAWTSVVLTADANTAPRIFTTWYNRVIW